MYFAPTADVARAFDVRPLSVHSLKIDPQQERWRRDDPRTSHVWCGLSYARQSDLTTGNERMPVTAMPISNVYDNSGRPLAPTPKEWARECGIEEHFTNSQKTTTIIPVA